MPAKSPSCSAVSRGSGRPDTKLLTSAIDEAAEDTAPAMAAAAPTAHCLADSSTALPVHSRKEILGSASFAY